MPARPVKAFRQGSRKSEPGRVHREHRSAKGRVSNHLSKRSRRIHKSNMQQQFVPETKQNLNLLAKQYNADPKIRKKIHSAANDRKQRI